MTVKSFEAAKKICDLSGWSITNLKLQKLLYFTHMVFMGRGNGPLISEKFEAWDYGPVLPSLYRHVSLFGADPVGDRFYGVPLIHESKEAKILEEAWDGLKHKEGWELVAMTHYNTGAWAKNYVPGKSRVILDEDILEEYRSRYGEGISK